MLNKTFEEQYVLAVDNAEKEKHLSTLIAGSPDFYFYNTLHLLNIDPKLSNVDNKSKFKKLAGDWQKDLCADRELKTIKLRKSLLKFSSDSKETTPKAIKKLFDTIILTLGLNFSHYATSTNTDQDSNSPPVSLYPTTLDPKEHFDVQKLFNQHTSSYFQFTSKFEPTAYSEFVNKFKFTDDHIKDVLNTLEYPYYEGIVDDIIKKKASFNSYVVISNLTLPQLDKLAAGLPSIIDNNFVQCYLNKLVPNRDLNDWQSNKVVYGNYLGESLKFVNTLASSFNHIKLSVLYHYLKFEISHSTFNETLIDQYFKLPRSSYYYIKSYPQSTPQDIIRFNTSDISSIFKNISQSMDESLIKQILVFKFKKIDDIKVFSEYFDNQFLKDIISETKLLNLDANSEKWIQMIDNHNRVSQLRNRVDIEFLPSNPNYYHPDDKVEIQAYIKNVQHLIIKLFEINTINYYKNEQRQIDTDINLDGLVASEEFKYEYSDPPIARVNRVFQFPSLTGKRGIFVLEFIGNGKSSRALLRKGDLHFIQSTNHLGQLIRVIDEDSLKLAKTSVLVDGNTYKSNENGEIQIPFTNGLAGSKKITLIYENFSTLKTFSAENESYTISGGIHMENGSLIYGERAPIAVRCKLFLNGRQISISYIEEPTLTITSTDNSEPPIVTSKEVNPFLLSDDEESIFQYKVQENLKELKVQFQGKVRVLSKGNSLETLTFEKSIPVSTMNQSSSISQVFLKKSDDGNFKLCHYGKGGEPIANSVFNIVFKHWMFIDRINVTLQTDVNGIINLGPCEDITSIQTYRDQQYTYEIDQYRPTYTYPSDIHSKFGEVITLPFFSALNRSNLALYEISQSNRRVSKDLFSLIKLANKEISLSLPTGEFELVLQGRNGFRKITIHVCDGNINDDFLVGPSRILSYENSKVKSLSMNLQTKEKQLLIQLKNFTPSTRIHISSSYFLPNSILNSIDLIGNPGFINDFTKPQSEYFSGRELGDEINYIFNRKNESKVLPGNSLKKPSLLLHPFTVSKTSQSQETLNSGSEIECEKRYAGSSAARAISRKEKKLESSSSRYGPFFEFLQSPTQLLYNLKPNDKGELVLNVADFESSGKFLNVYAVDDDFIFSDSVILSQPEAKFKEIKLSRALDPSKHFKQDKLISTVQPGQLFEINNVDSSKFIIYDSLDKVLSLSKTLIKDKTTLNEFSFISNWEGLSMDQKKEKFSKYTCHELNFFIFNKDKEFFNQVVLPFISCKMNKSFIDYYLTGNKEKLNDFIANSYRFNQLNTLEKILLAKVFPEHAKSIQTNINQQNDFQPILSIQYDEYFKIALNQLDSDIESVADYEQYSASDDHYEINDEESISLGGGGNNYYGSNNNNNNNDMMSMPMESKIMSSASRQSGPIALAFAPPPPSPITPLPSMKMKKMGDGAGSRARIAPQLYQKIEKTEELAETHYYNSTMKFNYRIIPCNEFWRDYINHIASGNINTRFLSKYIAFTSSSFTESIMSLAVLDLPFINKESYSTLKAKDGKFSVTPTSPIIVFHQELVRGEIESPDDGILINQNFFDINNRYSYEDNESVETYVKEEFLVSRVYGAKVVIANLTSRKKKLDILLQIPRGAIPVGPNPFYTRDFSIELYPYSNRDLEYYFYFPGTGKFTHFPTHVSEKNKIVSSTKPFDFSVVAKPTIVNQLSWQYIANFGTIQQVIEHLEKANLYRITFADLYHRYSDKKIWEQVIQLLKSKKFYEHTTWGYSLHHQSVPFAREYLIDRAKSLSFGKSIKSELIDWSPLENGDMTYHEYSPLVNSRTHKLGAERKILNDKFAIQYSNFINLLTFKLNPSDSELLSTVYYLLLQDRFNDAILMMNRVGKTFDQNKIITTTISSNSNNNNNDNNETIDKKKLKEDEKKLKEEAKRIKKEEKEKAREEKDKLKEEKKKVKEDEKKLKKAGKSGETTPTVTTPPIQSTTVETTTTTTTTGTTPTPLATNTTTTTSSIGFNLKAEGDDSENVIDITSFTPPKSQDLTIQFEYLISYLDFFNSNPAQAKYLSKKYQDYPVQRWNSLFRDMKNKIDQIYNIDSSEINYDKEIDRERVQAKMATNEPSFDVSIENSKQISVSYSNSNEMTVNYYIMDIELLFSTNPFVQQELGQFLYVVPNKIESYPLTSKAGTLIIDIPQEFLNKNIMIDCQSGQIHHNITVYSNNLSVHITEKVGQLRIINKSSKKPISKAYVKVYSKTKSNKVEFWKDGYSDISGYIDYSTVSNGNISDVSKFSILILSDEFGSLIKECKPPSI